MKVRLFESIGEARDAIPEGELKEARIDDQSICLLIDRGKIHAFENLCPHRGQKLHLGNINGFNEVVCPLHSYRFNWNTGQEAWSRCRNVRIYEVSTSNDGIWIEL